MSDLFEELITEQIEEFVYSFFDYPETEKPKMEDIVLLKPLL